MLCRGCRSPRAELGPGRLEPPLLRAMHRQAVAALKPRLGQMQKGKAQGAARLCFPAQWQPLQGGMLMRRGLPQETGPCFWWCTIPSPETLLCPRSLLPGACIIKAPTSQRYESEPCAERLSSQDGWCHAVPLCCATVPSLLGLSS